MKFEETVMVLTALVRCLTSYTLQRESGREGHYSSLSLTERESNGLIRLLSALSFVQ